MNEMKRVSPVTFDARAARSEQRDLWAVVLEYENENPDACITDLSHRPRFDCQDADIGAKKPFGLDIPGTIGRSVLSRGILVNRMNRTQAAIWHLSGAPLETPEDTALTDVTDATVCLALMGKHIFSVCEKLTALDFLDPGIEPPFLLQGPLSHVPCQITVLDRGSSTPGMIFTCSRGYADDMVRSVMAAGREFNMTPAGEDRVTHWINTL